MIMPGPLPTPKPRTKFMYRISNQDFMQEELLLRNLRRVVDQKDVGDKAFVFCPPPISDEASRLNVLEEDLVKRIEDEVQEVVLQTSKTREEVGEFRLQMSEVKSDSLDTDPNDIVQVSFIHRYDAGVLRTNAVETVTVNSPASMGSAKSNQTVSSSMTEKRILEDETLTAQGLREIQMHTALRKNRSSRVWDQKIRAIVNGIESKENSSTIHKSTFHAKYREMHDVSLPVNRELAIVARASFRIPVDDYSGERCLEWEKLIANTLPEKLFQANLLVCSSLRFSLPLDLSALEGLTCLDYLNTFCHIQKEREAVYEGIYLRLSIKARIVRENILREAADALLFFSQSQEVIDQFIELLDLPINYSFQKETFEKCLALCDRMHSPKLKGCLNDQWIAQAGLLERLDFQHIDKRIQAVKVKPALIRLLTFLNSHSEETYNWQAYVYSVVAPKRSNYPEPNGESKKKKKKKKTYSFLM